MADRWADMLDEINRQRAELARVGEVMGRVTAHAVSPDKLLSVAVDSRGLLTELTIEPLALRRYRADQLSSAITELVAEADQRLQDKRNQIFAAAVQLSPDYADVRPDEGQA